MGLHRNHLSQAATLTAAVAAIGTGAIIVRYVEAPALTKAAWRCTLAALALAPAWMRWRRRVGPSQSVPWGPLLAAGAFLALHFWTWIASLDHTSVAVSVLLVNTTPAWVVLLGPRLTGERTRPGAVPWMALAFLGAAVPLLSDIGRLEGLLGPSLALGGAVSWAAYGLLTKRAAGAVPLGPSLFLCYGAAAIVLLLLCLFTDSPLEPASKEDLLGLIALALVPQLIGHSLWNLSLRSLPSVVVTLASLGEPVVSTLLAWWFLSEAPPRVALIAAPLVLLGVLGVARRTA